LNASTGAVIWHSTVDTPSTTQDDYYAWGSPLVASGHVYVGISSNCDDPLVPAGVVEFNQATGALQATWHALPKGQTGASVWSTPATSTLGDHSVFVTTGNGDTSAANQQLYAESIVRLSGSNLSLLDSWQVPGSQRSTDGDFGGSPTDFTADLNGTSTPMVGACNKNGIYYAFRQDDLHAGPVWQYQMTVPSGTGPNPDGECIAAAVWDGSRLIEGGGDTTTINGTTYQGSVVSLNPATGTPIWQTGLPGAVIGSPAEDGSGVITAPVFQSTTGNLGVYLLNASTGAILGFISTNPSLVFGQPVFAGKFLLVASTALTAYQITTPGPPVTAVTPDAIGQGVTKTVTLTGSGFSGTPSVFVSGGSVTVSSVVVKSSTQLQVTLAVGPDAVTGARNITVIEPGPVADTCSDCLTIDSASVTNTPLAPV
jgi:outer membrane protein assembly factor BamB